MKNDLSKLKKTATAVVIIELLEDIKVRNERKYRKLVKPNQEVTPDTVRRNFTCEEIKEKTKVLNQPPEKKSRGDKASQLTKDEYQQLRSIASKILKGQFNDQMLSFKMSYSEYCTWYKLYGSEFKVPIDEILRKQQREKLEKKKLAKKE